MYATVNADPHANLNTLLREARPRLLRLARLNGVTADYAEDVVQETCLEAWRHLHKLREPERFASWLDGICRNVCRRHARAVARSAQETYVASIEDGADMVDVNARDPHAFDPGEALERQDRHILLERALGYLTASTRELVELCYLAELPQREVAQRLDLSLGALELRLHRARRQLRQVLNGALRADAEAFGLLATEDESTGWREVRKWCPLCGKLRLRGTIEHRPSGDVVLRLRCPDCSTRYGFDVSGSGDITSFAGMRSLLPAVKHGMRAACEYFSTAVHLHVCGRCRSPVRVQLLSRHGREPEHAPMVPLLPLFPQRSCLLIHCPQCGEVQGDLVNGLLLEPAARAFLLNRPRVLIKPDTPISYAGQDAICSRLIDLDTSEHVMIVAHPETAQTIATLLQ